ncbi:MAG: hypothetical protein WC052_04365 [Patescibacteria group bacterium]
MATTGPGIDPFGELYLGTARATDVFVGKDAAIHVDNGAAEDVPVININGDVFINDAPIFGSAIGDYWATPGQLTVATGAPFVFAATGYQNGAITKTSDTNFSLPTGGVYRVTWRASGSGVLGSGWQAAINLVSGSITAPAVTSTPGILGSTRVGASASTSTPLAVGIELTGTIIIATNGLTPTVIQLVNSGATTITGNSPIDSSPVTTAGMTIQRLA